jgi:hypothetical protein
MQLHRLISILVATALLAFAPGAGAEEEKSLDFALQSEVRFGWTWVDERGNAEFDDESYPLIAGAARGSIPLCDKSALQLDLEGLSNFTSRSDGEDNFHNFFAVTGHVALREPESFAAGAFTTWGSAAGGEDEDATFWLVGAEGQLYLGNTTLYGQAGYFEADDETENDVMTDAWFARAVVRQFLSPNQRISAEGSYAAGEANQLGPPDIRMASWELRYDQAFADTPLGFFVGYYGMWGEVDPSAGPHQGLREHTGFVGLTLTLGYQSKMSLLDNDRYGATFDTPPIGHWTGYTLEVIDD